MMENLDVISLAGVIPEYPVGDFGFLLPAFDDAESNKVLAIGFCRKFDRWPAIIPRI
jgi:hypothetical protein